MQCSSTAVASCLRLLATIFLLLAMAGRCHSQQLDNIQLSRIQGSIETLTHVVQELSENVTSGIGKLSEDVTAGIGKIFNFLAIDHLYCENGWLKLRSSCYFLGKDTSNWEQSRQKCLALDSDLVTITRDEEYNFLRDLAKGHDTYVGLSDLQEEGTYRWVADGTIHQIVESWWGEGEPNKHESREHCVHFFHYKGDRLNDHICANEFRGCLLQLDEQTSSCIPQAACNQFLVHFLLGTFSDIFVVCMHAAMQKLPKQICNKTFLLLETENYILNSLQKQASNTPLRDKIS
ncbi:LOW QUALITY PROTEIN: CD209 antigen-like [Macrobrachium nipponense]|uniref:LOW QUALITY PROTEIN: CD209 antigen-like n=1 Tax=Macrobrachium nipponense TaxID=159736 RepID=UPI0030C81946